VLPFRDSKDEDDEKHVHPLQLDVIERFIDLRTMPGETVLTPFMGVGSEVYAAVRMGRHGIGAELKPSYYEQAVRNLAAVDDLAPRLGVSFARVGHLTNGRFPRVRRTTATRIAAVYDELSMTVPQDLPAAQRHTIKVHARQRRFALQRGWAPPLAWDDNIDDPNAQPYVPADDSDQVTDEVDEVVVERVLAGEWDLPTIIAERTEICRRWYAAGGTLYRLKQLSGWKPERYYRINEAAA
jgi:hypothetical protein